MTEAKTEVPGPTTLMASALNLQKHASAAKKQAPMSTVGEGNPPPHSVKQHIQSAFIPRTSVFDRDNIQSQQDPFRGFYTLFWIGVFLGSCQTLLAHYTSQGTLWSLVFTRLISADAKVLALSDAVLVLSTLMCVPYAKLLLRGWFNYRYAGMAIHHVFQALYLGLAVRWTFLRRWPWVQSGFLTLHSLSMLMKIHSYCTVNGELYEVYQLRNAQLKQLESLIKEKSLNWDDALAEAQAARAKSSSKNTQGTPVDDSSNSVGTGTSRTTTQNFIPPYLRRRSSAVNSTDTSEARKHNLEAPRNRNEAYTDLVWHPDDAINSLALVITENDSILTSKGDQKVVFPDNVTFTNFVDYLLIPTLVYELEYPRTGYVRPWYILEKTLATFGTFSLIILTVEYYIMPNYPDPQGKSFLHDCVDLSLPFTLNFILIFVSLTLAKQLLLLTLYAHPLAHTIDLAYFPAGAITLFSIGTNKF